MNKREKHEMETIITKEAQLAKLEREIKQHEKRIRAIETSKTWRYSKLLKKFPISPNGQDDTEAVLASLQNELMETREQLHHIQLDDRYLNSYRIAKLVREAKDHAEIIPLLNRVLEQKEKHERNYNDALQFIARHYMNDDPDTRNFIHSRVLEGLKIEDIPEIVVRSGLAEEDPIPLKQAASFRASLTMRMRKKQLGGFLPEWLLDDKLSAYQFVDALEVKRPWTSEEIYPLEELPKKEKIAIKPVDGAGSRGVYLIYSFRDIVDIKRQKKLSSWEELLESMKQDLDTGSVASDEWLIEELIVGDARDSIPANDIKFYCFYGKVGLVLEINRYPELMYAWWTRSGERLRTGKYDGYLFRGDGVTEKEIALAESISKEIPAPFIRIDFLRSADGLVFGEFTPKPGNYDEFSNETDQRLGDLFLEAEARLEEDLYNGKPFTRFRQFQANLEQDM